MKAQIQSTGSGAKSWTGFMESLAGRGVRSAWLAVGSALLEVPAVVSGAPGVTGNPQISSSLVQQKSHEAGQFALAIAARISSPNFPKGGMVDSPQVAAQVVSAMLVAVKIATGKRSREVGARREAWCRRLMDTMRQLLAQSANDVCRNAIAKGLEDVVAETRADKLLCVRALDAAVEVCAKLRGDDGAFAILLLQYLREWNGLGSVGDAWFDGRREVALLRYVGVDEGFLQKYDQAKAWCRSHPDDEKAARDFLWTARPLAEALATDCRFGDAVQVFEGVVAVNNVTDEQKLGVRNVIVNSLVLALSTFRYSVDDAKTTLQRLMAVGPDKGGDKSFEREWVDLCLRAASIASKREDFNGATRLYDGILAAHSDCLAAQEGLAWLIEHRLRRLAADLRVARRNRNTTSVDARSLQKTVGAVLSQYNALKDITRPSEVHSCVLAHMTSLSPFVQDYVATLRAWDSATFRNEDFIRAKNAATGKTYPSLVERVMGALYKAISDPHRYPRVTVAVTVKGFLDEGGAMRAVPPPSEGCDAAVGIPGLRIVPAIRQATRAEDARWAADFFSKQCMRLSGNSMLLYYRARLLAIAGDSQKARSELVRLAAAFRDEYWFWNALAGTYESTETEVRLACLCRAVLCGLPAQPAFADGLRRSLASSFEDAGLLAEAKHEYERLLTASMRHVASAKLALPAFLSVTASNDNATVYAQYAAKADAVVFCSLPWSDGVMTNKQRDEKGTAIGFLIAVPQAESLIEVMCPARLAPSLGPLPSGAPVRVRLAQTDGKWVLLAVEERSGTRWDVYPARSAVLVEVNLIKGVSVAEFQSGDCCFIQHSLFPNMVGLSVGTAVAVKTQEDRIRKQHIVVTIEADQNPALSEFRRPFEEKLLKAMDRGGSTVDGIWIPRRLLAKVKATEGARVAGVAIKAKNGWRAVTLIKQD